MSVKAKLKYLREAPRKVRLVADMVRGKKVKEARIILNFTTNKAARIIGKLLNQAASSAKNNFQLDEEDLFISKITIDGGPILKRFRPRARGSAYAIQKKTSHITLILDSLDKNSGQTVVAKEKGEKSSEEAKKEVIAEKTQELKKSAKPRIKPENESKKKPQADQAKRKIFRRQTF